MRRSREQGLKVTTVSSSTASAIKAQQLGLTVLDFEQVNHVDMYVDGADEVSPELTLLKLDVQVFKFFAAGSLEKSSGSPVV